MYAKIKTMDVDAILNVLGDKRTENDIMKVRKTLKQVLILQTKGSDTELLFPVVVKYIASNDMICKKIAYSFVRNHGHRQDLILLAINSLLKDCTDPSPMTRGLALRTLTDIPNQIDYSIPQVQQALDDSSAYVRRIAVMACVKIHNENPEVADSCGFVDLLYDRIRDSDPIVVVNCLNGLEEMLAAEGGAVINKSIAYYLLNNIRMFSDWSLVSILKFLKRYTPASEDEIYAVMNLADYNLAGNNATVVLSTMEYFLLLVDDLPHLMADIFERASAQLLHILSLGHPEINSALLEEFTKKLENQEFAESMRCHYQSFFCRQTDPVYLKELKMTILPRLVSSENMADMVAEISLQCTDSDPAVVKMAVKALGKIAKDSAESLELILPKFSFLLSRQNRKTTSEVLQTLPQLDLTEYPEKDAILEHIKNAANLVKDTEGKCALFVLFGMFGKDISEAPYIIETFIDDAGHGTDEVFMCELLSCAVKLFKCRPTECQEMLGRLLEICYQDKRVHVQDRAKFFYSLLKSGLMPSVC